MMNLGHFQPKLFKIMFKEGYSKEQFLKDINAGVVVGIIALPLSIALAIASGVKPEQGLYTAIVAGFLISFFSGSRVQIGGPTGAFVVVLSQIVAQYGYDGLAVAGIMAGIILILMGFLGMGTIIKYIPYPVTVGFTTGIALVIFSGQIKDFLGIRAEGLPSEFHEKIYFYINNLHNINYSAAVIGLIAILIIIFFPKVNKKIPGSLVAVIVTTLLVKYMNIPVETIGSNFGEVPNTLRLPSVPSVDLATVKNLIQPAISIAILAGIESLLSAVVSDGMIGGKHNSNMELVGQGIANIVSPIFGGIPATGAIARTATNIKNGGRTPVAGIVHAITLMLIMLFFGKFSAMIPMATLAAILIVVSYNMSELAYFIKLFKSPKSDVSVLITTFLLTVFIDLTVAIEIGMVLSAFLFMKRMADVTGGNFVTDEFIGEENDSLFDKSEIPKGIEVYEIQGAFFFGAADKFTEILSDINYAPEVLILRMREVSVIDATGLRALEHLVKKCQHQDTALVLSGVKAGLIGYLKKSGIFDLIGEEKIFSDYDISLDFAKDMINKQVKLKLS
ncbi:sulfate permease [uncultured Ilyobacter sp.]|uniref:SulP family inorganic anion transporter n=1 Tax=uncultured Ilyobacter sp. TaxID=544433 RepID=UPI0029C0D602|nr:sulfate permease [uncultured Ilyobacter sp.]